MKNIFTCLSVTFFIWNSNLLSAQDNEHAACFAEKKIRARKSYHLFGAADSSRALWTLTDRDEYDQQGRQTRWRQYDYSDSTKYSDRVFKYNKSDAAERSKKKLLDSVGMDKNGFVTYRTLYKPYSEQALERFLKIEITDKSRPIKVSFFDTNAFQVYMVFFYNDKNNITEKRFCFPNDSIFESTFYSYYGNGTIKEIKKTRGAHAIDEIKLYNNAGFLVEEIHYNEEDEGEISYKIVRSYNSAGYETENITSTMVIGMLRPSRREVSEYNGCLKSTSIIYSIDSFSGEETSYTIVQYRYHYFD